MEGIFRRNGELEVSEEIMHSVVNGTRLEECVSTSEHDILCVCHAIKVGISGMAEKAALFARNPSGPLQLLSSNRIHPGIDRIRGDFCTHNRDVESAKCRSISHAEARNRVPQRCGNI